MVVGPPILTGLRRQIPCDTLYAPSCLRIIIVVGTPILTGSNHIPDNLHTIICLRIIIVVGTHGLTGLLTRLPNGSRSAIIQRAAENFGACRTTAHVPPHSPSLVTGNTPRSTDSYQSVLALTRAKGRRSLPMTIGLRSRHREEKEDAAKEAQCQGCGHNLVCHVGSLLRVSSPPSPPARPVSGGWL